MIHTLLIILICPVGIIAISIGAYIAYLFLSYKRLPDRMELKPENHSDASMKTGTELHIISWNVGFGAYSDDYSFFMNGGTQSRAYSKSAAVNNIEADIRLLKKKDPDIMLLQEVDEDSHRAWHTNEAAMFRNAFGEYSSTYAINYDSAYLFWPPGLPHGASRSGILTLVRAGICSSIRRKLPIEEDLMRFLDLDRCYSISRIPTDNDRELCLFALHLSAYTTDGSIATEQLAMLLDEMDKEYRNGNYVIAGGDFNKDIRGDASAYTGISGRNYSWAKPFPTELLPGGFTLVNSFDPENIVDSCRASDAPYTPGETFTVTLDAFIVSDNISAGMCRVIDAKFKNSDHNPIEMKFSLNKS